MVGSLDFLSGLSASVGYQLIQKNTTKIINNFQNDASVKGEIQYFETTTAKLKTVNDFINNPRLVNFVLSAFSLDSESDSLGLIKKVLTQDPSNSKSLVNQLTDPRFKQLATALDFYNDGLGKLQGLFSPKPTSATQTEAGYKYTPSVVQTLNPPTVKFADPIPALPPPATAATPPSLGVTVGGSGFIVLQKPDGTAAYAKSAYFSINSSHQLALADGTLLEPSLTIPADATALNIDKNGKLYAKEPGQSSPTLLGQLTIATFADSSKLSTNGSGISTETGASGPAQLGNPNDTTLGLGSTFAYGNTFFLTPGADDPTYTTPLQIGFGIGGKGYLELQNTDGTASYAKSGYFTVNSDHKLALSDGTLLKTNFIIPSNATAINIDAKGNILVREPGQNDPVKLGQLTLATFNDPTSLSTNVSGISTATAASGSAQEAFAQDATLKLGSTYAFGDVFNPISLATKTAATTSVTGTATPKTPINLGLAVGGNGFLKLTKTDGTEVYAKSAYFTVNANNQLALPDGTQLFPSLTVPADTTALTVDSKGTLYAQVKGAKNPVTVGVFLLTTFTNPGGLQTDKTGYLTKTVLSGRSYTGLATDPGLKLGSLHAYGNTFQDLVNNYVTNEFELAAGEQNSALREALYFQRHVAGVTNAPATKLDPTGKITDAEGILGDNVLRDVALTTLQLPKEIARQLLTTQVSLINDRLDVKQFQKTDYTNSFIKRYLGTVDNDANSSSSSGQYSVAAQLVNAIAGNATSSSSQSSSSTGIASLFQTSA